MPRTTVTRRINAPIRTVFQTVSEIEHFSAVLPHIVDVKMLSEQTVGVGTRFRETRIMNGREGTTELEVTEYVPDEHVRLVSDQGGAIWDTVFSVREVDGATELSMVMDARPYKLLARLYIPFIGGVMQTAVEKDMDLVKAWCEAGVRSAG